MLDSLASTSSKTRNKDNKHCRLLQTHYNVALKILYLYQLTGRFGWVDSFLLFQLHDSDIVSMYVEFILSIAGMMNGPPPPPPPERPGSRGSVTGHVTPRLRLACYI